MTPAQAGAVNSTQYQWFIEDGGDFEIFRGTYSTTGPTLTRDTVLVSKIGGTVGTTKLNLSGTAKVYCCAVAQDIDVPKVSSIEVGHVTDTTISRGAAGEINVEGSRVFQRNNILGTVSQTSGVPTGALIESGSNANGTYVRFADGTQICTGSVSASLAINTAMLGGFRSSDGSETFAAEFVSAPICLANQSGNTAITVNVIATSGTGAAWNCTSVSSQASAATRSGNYIAIGRWF